MTTERAGRSSERGRQKRCRSLPPLPAVQVPCLCAPRTHLPFHVSNSTAIPNACSTRQAHGFPCKVVASSAGQLGVRASRAIRGGERICTERPLTLTVPAGKPVAPRARRRPPPLTAQSSAVQRRADTTRTVQQARGGTSARSASKTAARKGAPSGSAIAAPAGSFDFAPRPVNLCCLRPIPAPSVRQWWRRTGTPRLMKTAKAW